MNGEDWEKVFYEALTAMSKIYGPPMHKAAEMRGLPHWWPMLWLILEYEPEPVTLNRLRSRNPYSAPERLKNFLKDLTEDDLLAVDALGNYRLTDEGRHQVKEVIAAYEAMVATLDLLPAAETGRLAELMHTVIAACEQAPDPPGTNALTPNRKSDPGPDAPALTRVSQYLTDLNAFREDAHLSAWRPLDIEGHVWETFTLVWNEEAQTAEDLVEKLSQRSLPEVAYANALQELEQRGWATTDGEIYTLTDAGRKVREEVEETTNRYFFGPWQVLSGDEYRELVALTAQLRDAASDNVAAPA